MAPLTPTIPTTDKQREDEEKKSNVNAARRESHSFHVDGISVQSEPVRLWEQQAQGNQKENSFKSDKTVAVNRQRGTGKGNEPFDDVKASEYQNRKFSDTTNKSSFKAPSFTNYCGKPFADQTFITTPKPGKTTKMDEKKTHPTDSKSAAEEKEPSTVGTPFFESRARKIFTPETVKSPETDSLESGGPDGTFQNDPLLFSSHAHTDKSISGIGTSSACKEPPRPSEVTRPSSVPVANVEKVASTFPIVGTHKQKDCNAPVPKMTGPDATATAPKSVEAAKRLRLAPQTSVGGGHAAVTNEYPNNQKQVEGEISTKLQSYKTLTLDEIIDMYQVELSEDCALFAKESQRALQDDIEIKTAEKHLVGITKNTQNFMLQQYELFTDMNKISDVQLELESTLKTLESNTNQLFEAFRFVCPQNCDREIAFKYAESAECRLENLRVSLLRFEESSTPYTLIVEDEAMATLIEALHETGDRLARLEVKEGALRRDIQHLSENFSTMRS